MTFEEVVNFTIPPFSLPSDGPLCLWDSFPRPLAHQSRTFVHSPQVLATLFSPSPSGFPLPPPFPLPPQASVPPPLIIPPQPGVATCKAFTDYFLQGAIDVMPMDAR